MNALQSHAEPRRQAHAHAKITVHSSEAKPYDETAGPALTEIHISETFSGDLDGESMVRALQVRGNDKSASMVSIQRFQGNLSGRRGTFVLQGVETMDNGRIKALSFLGRGQVSLLGCAARAALKASLEKAPRERWITGSNDVGPSRVSGA